MLKLTVWKYYYLQQDYKARNGKYATSIDILTEDFPGVTFNKVKGLKLFATDFQFTLLVENPRLKLAVSVDHDSKFVVKKLQ